MSDPAVTSPEVADACRRAGLPYQAPAVAGYADAMGAAPAMAGSYAGEQVERGLSDLSGVVATMSQLYGPALPAPANEALQRIRSAWLAYTHEVWEGHRDRERLARDVIREQYRAADLEGERDRARDLAAQLEAELAEVDVAAALATAPVRRRALLEAIETVRKVTTPLGVPAGGRDSAYNQGRTNAHESAIAALHEAMRSGAGLPGVSVVEDPTLPPDVVEVRGATTARIRIGDVPEHGGGTVPDDGIVPDPTTGAVR